MAIGWFHSAAGAFKRREAVPQPFELICDCGARVTGLRAESPQKLSCTNCGTMNFVLPACQFPIPVSVKRAWLGEETPPALPAKKKTAAKSSPPVRSRKGRTEAEAPPEAPPVLSAPRRMLSERLRSAVTPVRMVVLLIVVTVALTGVVLVRGSRQEWAREHLRPAIDRGVQALHERDFSAAAEAFDEAGLALERLGRHDASALAVHQLKQETELATKLSSSTLTEVLADVAVARQNADLAERFQTYGSGEWFLFDAVVEPDRGNGAGRMERCLVDVPLALGERPLLIAFDDVPWPRFWKSSGSERAQRMVFAAELDRLELTGDKSRRPTLLLRTSTAVLWCHGETYEAVAPGALDPEQAAELRAVLQRQREALGVGEMP